MNKTKVEWVRNPDGSRGYTWNPITGCLNHDNGLCKGGGFPCYACGLAYGRLNRRYLANGIVAYNYDGEGGEGTQEGLQAAFADPFYPRFWPERIPASYWIPTQGAGLGLNVKGKGIFVCDMGELFGDWIPQQWQKEVFKVIRGNPDCRFYLLTKQPQNLVKFSPFPDNCWVGVTATDRASCKSALLALAEIRAKVKYISFEPLLSPAFCHHHWHTKGPRTGRRDTITSTCEICGDSHSSIAVSEDFNRGHKRPIIGWLIIGAWTGSIEDKYKLRDRYPELKAIPYQSKVTLQPKIEWVREIVEAADRAGIPVFLKDNLNPLFAKNNCEGFEQCKSQLFTITDNFPTRYHLRQEMPDGSKEV